MSITLATFVFTTLTFGIMPAQCSWTPINFRPIIGILSQETSDNITSQYPKNYSSYIAASYVKFIEGSGARVAPIWIGKNESYYEDILGKVNGVLLPDGSSSFSNKSGYVDAADMIYNISKKINKKGDYFPIFGISLGLQVLTYLEAGRKEHRINCSSDGQLISLNFTSALNSSKMFNKTSPGILHVLNCQEITGNYHNLCVTTEGLRNVSVDKEYNVLSINNDYNGVEFVSTLEHDTLPFYGVQFDPVKNLYEWVKRKNITHTQYAYKVTRYFGDFFISEARKNMHKFPTKEEAGSLIYNYTVTYTAPKIGWFLQTYLFNENDTN
ncbi:PREDICTED: gamma-glutamyl hydrolase A-like [Habropoda laboriosa]|uniref:gamma-glutamyl hydrolase A-like n=1 Tax=Habropoda laboriosa TaxID=597456 RepID=UPI00083E137D|nr:PREDICTED: gamma-glutamyl hydrolase A-like [Habropoda laboriosa]